MHIPYQRLYNQRLSHTDFTTPAQAVAWLGAVQSQDYAGAKWAVGQRAHGVNDEAVERAFNEGAILRTHVLRPTWHFVAAEDIRWMLLLTAPRVQAVNAYMYRQQELDDALFVRSNAAIEKALAGGKHLTRTELATVLEQSGINAATMRLSYIMMRAELDGVICSGARQGKQQTYALIAERAPHAKTLTRDEALVELTRRYFVSRGPATVKDYCVWSGLTAADAKTGIDMLKGQLVSETFNEQLYWFSPDMPPAQEAAPRAYWLPNYDEYVGSHTYYGALFEAQPIKIDAQTDDFLSHAMVFDGRIVGTWRRTEKKRALIIETKPIAPLGDVEIAAFSDAARRYSDYLGAAVEWS